MKRTQDPIDLTEAILAVAVKRRLTQREADWLRQELIRRGPALAAGPKKSPITIGDGYEDA